MPAREVETQVIELPVRHPRSPETRVTVQVHAVGNFAELTGKQAPEKARITFGWRLGRSQHT